MWVVPLQLFWIPAPFKDIGRSIFKKSPFLKLTLYVGDLSRLFYSTCSICVYEYLQNESYPLPPPVSMYDIMTHDSVMTALVTTALWRVEWLSISVSMMRHGGPPPYRAENGVRGSEEGPRNSAKVTIWESHPQTKYQARQQNDAANAATYSPPHNLVTCYTSPAMALHHI